MANFNMYRAACCWYHQVIRRHHGNRYVRSLLCDFYHRVSFKEMWEVLSKNRQVQLYMLTAVSDKLAQQTMSQSVVDTMMVGILIGSYVASTMVGNFTTLVGLVSAFGSGVFVSKMGVKKATKVFSWASIALSVLMVVYCFLLGGPNGMNNG